MSLNPKIQDWHGLTVWLVGASSGIGRAVAASLHSAGARVIVSARQADLLNDFAAQHPGAQPLPLDVMDAQALQQAVRQIVRNHGRIDLCLYCAGYYQPMRAQQFSLDEAMRHLDINYVGALKLLQALLPQMLLQAHQGQPGHISLVSSVAGYRGLPKSLAYGPSKAALSHLAEALYLDLSPEKIGVSVINPGFVATPLTAQNDFAMPALITADQAAQEILKGWARGEFEIHFPKRFTLWLKLLRHLGHGLYFRAVRRATGL
ncbi:SDR family NAD(P)-dependent oxidoreductase [Paucibacter sp. DJ2R-2]|uniref:SDR family NAD(P)-dependent oxidoreductase n=1 Tax=Paucibacter sp. DJ2R-2 TaxID=2893558 RepID=UPI0021E39D1C|nr:SDR family NAD(P)-dependent oxidoreductase [Paucibacter sp. DJ2R-2]MCV2419696.1 SDR family NAD(P)-dependent oxidoreductase [Paucibacter sp. DJ4R-1]MCV2437401.1 SDR family NAD(P)-dependent oxidoreductase [Paucibacter sp. DJ2R-2]